MYELVVLKLNDTNTVFLWRIASSTVSLKLCDIFPDVVEKPQHILLCILSNEVTETSSDHQKLNSTVLLNLVNSRAVKFNIDY